MGGYQCNGNGGSCVNKKKFTCLGGCIMMSMAWGVWMERNYKENKNSRGKQVCITIMDVSSSLISKGHGINSIC